jgi:hypothetical protein
LKEFIIDDNINLRKRENNLNEDLIMDLDPKNFNKKDHVFMDFIALYGKNFIEN